MLRHGKFCLDTEIYSFIYLYHEGGQISEQVGQRGCAASFLGDTQSLTRNSPEQFALTGPALSSWWSWVAS